MKKIFQRVQASNPLNDSVVVGGGTLTIAHRRVAKRRLIVFAAVFAAIGAIIILRSFADTTTVNDSTTGTGTNQFEFVGNWTAGSDTGQDGATGAYGSDEHYSNDTANGGAYYQVRFRGTQVNIYTTTAPHHGIAAVSIDGGAETTYDSYSTSRTNGVLVYTSPVLSDADHIIKVRVTGTKNPASTNTYVIADKIEVITITSPTTTTTAPGCPAGVSPAAFPSRLKTSGRNLVDENGCVMSKLKGFNMHVGPGFTWPQSHFNDIAALAPGTNKINRTVVTWPQFEPSQGVVSGPANPTDPNAATNSAIYALDNHIARAQAAGIYTMLEIHLNVGAVPSWTTGASTEMEKYAMYGKTLTQYLAKRYGDPASPKYTKAVLGFSLNEPPLQDNAIRNGNGSIPYLEGKQKQMIQWFRASGYAPDWIGFVALGYASQTPIYDDATQNSAAADANPTAYNDLGAGIPGGNVVYDLHDYMIGCVRTKIDDPNCDGRQWNGNIYSVKNGSGGFLAGPDDGYTYTSTATTKSQFAAFAKPYKNFLNQANIPLMIGEWGWTTNNSSDELSWIKDKQAVWSDAGSVIEMYWNYDVAWTNNNNIWSSRPDGTNWRPSILEWMKSSSTTTPPPPSTSPPPSSTSLSLKLINADNDQVITPMTSGMTIDLATARNLNIDVSASTPIESVRFDDNGSIVTENFPPYAIGRDAGTGSSDYYPWTPTVGAHTLTVKAYSADAAGGTELASVTITFTVKDSSTTTTTTPGWELVYEDSFDTLNVNSDCNTNPKCAYSWSRYNGPGHAGNGLRRPEAFSIVTDPSNSANKLLAITAENYVDPADGVTKIRSGGMANRTNLAYGKYEVRARTEVDQTGTMSGLALTWPQSGKHPADGELDWYETGTTVSRNPIRSFFHWPCSEGACTYNADGSLKDLQSWATHNFTATGDSGAQWHTYTMEWTPTYIKMFRDGQLIKMQDGTDAITDIRKIPDVPHHVCLQLDALANRTLAQTVHEYVDYVKVYKMGSTSTPGPDTTAPTVSITSPVNNATVSGTVTATATASDAVGVTNVEFKLDGNTVVNDTAAPYNYSINTLTLANGVHTIEAIATDAAGNVSTLANNPGSKITINVQNVDTAAPNAPASLTVDPSSQLTAPGTVKLTWPAATDNGSPASGIKGYWVQRNGVTITCQGQTAGQPLTTLSCVDTNVLAGSYAYTVRSVDNVNLTSVAATATNPATLTINNPPDTIKPSTPTNLTATAISQSQINLSWTASTDNVGVAGYNIYRGTSATDITTKLNTNPVITTSFGSTNLSPDTVYYYQVEAVDAAGNVSEVKAGPVYAATFAADTLAPTVSIISPSNGATISGNVSVAARATDNVTVSRMEMYIDNKLYATSNSGNLNTTWNTNPKRWKGPRTVTVKAIDSSGNTASSTITVTVR